MLGSMPCGRLDVVMQETRNMENNHMDKLEQIIKDRVCSKATFRYGDAKRKGEDQEKGEAARRKCRRSKTTSEQHKTRRATVELYSMQQTTERNEEKLSRGE